MTPTGTGTPSFDFGRTTGVVRRFDSPEDVISSIDDDLESTVAVVRSGGTTFLSPILGRLGGVVALDGTLRSHLAIVSREFELPCLVGAELHDELPNGTTITLDVAEPGVGVITTGAPERDEVRDDRDVSSAWWDYVRRVGDEIAVKDFDLSVTRADLDALIAEKLDDAHLDDLVGHMGRTLKPELTRRSGFTSELFPMLPYMSLSVIEDVSRLPARLREIDAAMPAEEIGRRLREAPNQVSPLWIWMIAYHYLCGRECLIQMGRLRPDENIEDVRTVVDFWRRLSLAHRGDGTLDYKDAGFSNRYLPEPVVGDLVGRTRPVDADAAKALKRLNATISGYSFLYFCDSRVGICDSGPYPHAEGRRVIVRDYLSLGRSAWNYPWAESVDPPYAGVTMVLVYDPSVFTEFEINDWGTTFTGPGQLLSAVSAAAVIGVRADGSREVLAPEDWPTLTADLSREHMTLYQQFAAMDRPERVLAATRMYSSVLRPFAAVAGLEDEPGWSLSPATAELYPDPLDDDDRAAAVFGGALLAHDRPSAFSPIR
ncbi:PEP-utilizing enzyme [Actinomycetospora aeridis]|uniref:PEP-utilizing enzyme n=1 Tax=Actinomycetospora aeridis TaxID=3129231 RepID=A0ABU8NDS2_9PSEU